MKTATLHDLRTRLATIVEWVEHGEDVVVKGEPAAQTGSAKTPVDWSQSAVFRRRAGQKKIAMTAEELQDFYQEMRGSY
jgi:antitoxin (DNA-binding transcriptional repressor) of toxin-antitoxin stability system